MQKLFTQLTIVVFLVALRTSHAAVYKEQGGRVVVEAEHFDTRTTHATDGHHWAIMPDENNNPDAAADAGFANARGGKYVQSLPDTAGAGQNNNSVAAQNNDPHLDLKVQISNPGPYRLYMKWGGYDGSSDSIYASIVEMKAANGGAGPDWYRYVGNINGDFAGVWNGSGAPSTDAANAVGAGGGEVPAVYNLAAGTYTIRVTMREDGSAVDTIALQLASMPAPTDAVVESDTTTSVDTARPTLASAFTAGNPSGVFVAFNEQVSPSTATNKANYAINNGVTVNSVEMGPNNFTVLLHTTPLTSGTTYQVTVNNVQDVAATPNTIAGNSQISFLPDGFIERRVFLNISGVALDLLTNSPAFKADKPDIVDYQTSFEAPSNWADNYGEQMRGLLIPPATGNYVFFICSDDFSSLYLSTDENPANKHIIATETAWSNPREWVSSSGSSDTASKRSDQYPDTAWPNGNTITLTAGKSYYIEAIQKEGGGGDNLAVTWQMPGKTEPVNGDPPIPGGFLKATSLTLGPAAVTTPPANVTVLEPGSATFTVVPSGSPPFTFQWLSNGVPVAGATSQSFTIPITSRTGNGAQIAVKVSNAFSSATSAAATLTVNPDVTAPLPFAVTSVDATGKTIQLSFNELMDKASAQTAANYVFSGNIVATGATLDPNGTNLTLTTGTGLTAGTETTLTITGVKDISGNPVTANTTIKFTFNRVTYAATILFDKPVGYYQFEETTGGVAKNAGTVAGDGAYYIGDEATAGDGGAPSTPKGDPGPRPPTFAGFDAANKSATFGGPDLQDWVDTKHQFLQGLTSFSLEYWVKPVNRVADATAFGTRIGLVGQNDAIEYGFIDANTIQIWTPGGGSLNTAYAFPDNEWHHVATIADGKNLKTYYDGVIKGTGGSAITTDYGTSTFNVHIGGGGVFDGSGNYFTGNMDEVAIFDRAIPADRIAAHFKAGKEGGVLVTTGAITGGGTTGGGTGPKLTATKSGNNVTISWSPAGGTLQSTDSLSGTPTWTNVGTTNPATVTIGSGMKFYRVVTP